ncbi:MAG: VOC family protein [Verrucomicrobia bacterium]|nr:VOC family protein [Verrucomicrobiota bacterium]
MMTRFLCPTNLTVASVVLAWLGAAPIAQAADATNAFSKPTIDIGIVARDVEKTATFYREAIGLKEMKGFSAPAELGKKIGLVDNHPINVRVFVTEEIEGATRIKLMSFPAANGKLPDRSHIHSTIGINYLTFFVKDMDQALVRLKKAGVKLLGATPVSLGGKAQLVTFQDPDGNFVELIGPARD